MLIDRFRVTDRVAVLSAATGGIGRATAIGLAELGADLVLAARREADLEALADDIRALGRRAVVVPCDMRELSTIHEITDAAVSAFGRIDILINIIGGFGGNRPANIMDASVEYIENAFRFNLSICHELTRQALPSLLRSPHASIVNISSLVARLFEPGYLGYGTAKAALDHYTLLVADELAPRVRVNAVAPGWVATAKSEHARTKYFSSEVLERAAAGVPLQRPGTPEEVALAVLYLASDASSYATGSILSVDGGAKAPFMDGNVERVGALAQAHTS